MEVLIGFIILICRLAYESYQEDKARDYANRTVNRYNRSGK